MPEQVEIDRALDVLVAARLNPYELAHQYAVRVTKDAPSIIEAARRMGLYRRTLQRILSKKAPTLRKGPL